MSRGFRPIPVLLGVMLCAAGCQTTNVSTVWKSPQPLPPPFTKIAVFVANATPAERRAGEDELASRLPSGKGVRGYTLVADTDMQDKEKVRAALEAEGADGAVVLRLVASDKRTTYYPPNYQSNLDFDAYYTGHAYPVQSPGYAVTDTVVRAEVSVYSVRDRRLLWAGASTTDNPADVTDLVRQVAAASVEELRKQGMVR